MEDASEESDSEEFDPFLFIANLPPRQPIEQIALPPKSSSSPPITLVLDLDETLVHCGVDYLANADLEFPVEYQGQSFQVSFFSSETFFFFF